MEVWYANVYKGFIFTSVILFILSLTLSSGNMKIGATIAGYTTLALSIFLIMIFMLNVYFKTTSSSFNLQNIINIIFQLGPIMLTLFLIIILLVLNIKNKDKITDGHVSDSYNKFTNISTVLLLLQTYIIYSNIKTESFQKNGSISKVTSSLIYLIGVITSLCSIILFTILQIYTTDG
jgi:hypothetical protein